MKPLLPPSQQVVGSFCVDASVQRLAEATTTAVAATDGSSAFTYRQLNAATNWVAAKLCGAGVTPGDTVAVCMRRRPMLLAALLGGIRVGAQVLPLDPAHPVRRRQSLIHDARPTAILVDAGMALDVTWAPTIVVGEEDDPQILDGAADPHARQVDAAYVMYTSGSTGSPKGVMVGLASLNNYLQWAAKTYASSGGSGSIVHSSIAVDLTITSLFVPLLTGGCVTFCASDDIEDLADIVRRTAPSSFIKLTPTKLLLLTQFLTGAELRRSTHHVVLGGEQLTAAHLEPLGPEATGLPITNEYGPTEATVGMIACTFRHGADTTAVSLAGDAGDAGAAPVPIGYPIEHARAYILDADLEPVSVGELGDLFIAGKPLAHGYLNQPGLTAQSFVPDPFAHEGGARMYRTGDRVHQRLDAMIEFVGRTDRQVKLRGFRIELGEVEAVLRTHPGISDCAVLLGGEGHHQQLTAFVCAKAGAALTPVALRDYLVANLHAHMVPAAYVVLDSLPLTASGKIDLQALAAIETSEHRFRATAPQVEPPQSETEIIVATVWRNVLQIDVVGRNDSFFDVGGHSLLAPLMLAQLRDACGVELELTDVFENPTLGGMATAVDRASRRRTEARAIEAALAALPGVGDAAIVWTPAGEGDRLTAYWTRASGEALDGAEVGRRLRTNDPSVRIPDAFVLVADIPRAQDGSADVSALSRQHTTAFAPTAARVAPRTVAEEVLYGIWRHVFKPSPSPLGISRPMSVHDDFRDFGGTAIGAARVAQLAAESGLHLTADAIMANPTIAQQADIARREGRVWASTEHAGSGPMIVPMRANGSKPPVFFLHAIGGGTDFFLPLVWHLGQDYPCYGLRSEGLLSPDRVRHDVRLEELAATYVTHLRTVQPHGPYRLSSYSFGVHLAFLMALQLTRQGETVAFLGQLDAGPGHVQETNGLPSDIAYLLHLLKDFGDVPVSPARLMKLSPRDRVEYALDILRVAVDPHSYAHMEWIAPVASAHYRALDDYLAELTRDVTPYRFDGGITVFHATANRKPASHVVQTTDPAMTLGWAALSTQPVEVRFISGTHGSCLEEPHVFELADQFTECLKRSD